ncbi:MAG: MASE3 domain-containing protein [Methanoregula sp.]
MAEHASPPSLFPQASLVLTLACSAAAFVLLYLLSQSNYLLFHSIIEITTVVIGFSIFVLIINARKHIDNSYFFVIGIGFFFICTIDVIHTLAYKGMGVFPAATADLPTQLWIAGRYLQAATLLAAPLVIGRKIRLPVLFFGYAAVTALLLGSIWYGIFPHCFIEGQGLTPFKIGSEYLISFILILATIALYYKREYFDPRIFLLLAAANFLTIGAELAFTSYISVYGFMNMLGHLFRLAATLCFYMAFLVFGQEQPYELLWHRIWQKEKELKDLNATLADRVAVRTHELEETTLRLEEEIDFRKQADENLRNNEEKYHTVADFTFDWELWLGRDHQILYCSPSCERITGYPPEAFNADPQLYTKIVYPDDQFLMDEHNRTAWETLEARSVDFRIIHRDGSIRWIGHACQRVTAHDGTELGRRVSNRDITDRKQAEEELTRVNRALQMLSDANQAMVRITDETKLMNEICRIAVDIGGYRMAWIGFAEQDEGKTVRPVAHAGVDSGYIETAHLTWAEDSPRGRGPGGTAIRSGQPSMARNISMDHAFAPWRDEAMKRGYQSIIALPLTREGRTFGAMGIYASEADAFDSKEVKILKELANDLAYGIDALRTWAKQKQAEEAIRDLNDYNRSLIETSIDPLMTISKDGKIQDVNTATETATGLTRKELIGTDFSEYFTEPQKAREGYMRVFSEGKVLDYPLEIRHCDGHIMPVLYNAAVYPDRNGNIKGVFAAARDITERKRVEESLRESEEKFRSLVEYALDGILILDLQGTILFVNNAMARTIESDDPAGLIGRNVMEFIASESREDVVKDFVQVSQGHDAYLAHYYVISAKGKKIYVESIGKVIIYEGKPADLVSIRDVTERKQAEDALQKSEEKFHNVFDWANDAILLHTLTTEGSPGRFLDANPVACRMLGYSRAELLTMGPPDIVPAELHPQLGEIIRQTATKESVLFETRLLRKDSTTLPVESSGHLVTYDGKRTWVSHIRDITGRKQADVQRENLIHELARKNAELDRFTYTVSHDLKSPLLSIRAFLSLLEDDLKNGDSSRVKTDISRMSESAEKLESLITTLLALSRSGKSIDTPLPVPFRRLALDAAGLLDASLQKHGVTLIIPDTLPVVSGDRQRLLQVMTNLLDNAIKFMGEQPEPRVEVGVRNDAGITVFYVQDNGMGINQENLEKVFGLYERFHPDIPGTGIGLATVKRIIEAHKGKIWVESEGEGKGTTVCFTLPGIMETNAT